MNLIVFGFGYSTAAFVARARHRFDAVVATTRSAERVAIFSAKGLIARRFPGDEAALSGDLREADAVLVSAPPEADGDPVLLRLREALSAASRLRWIGYLSTVGVYGDHGGGWVDEDTPARPTNPRSRERLAAEGEWLKLGERSAVPVQIFRISGIYGPGRSAFDRLSAPDAKRVVKPGQVFNRIHVADIAAVLEASLLRPRAGAIYNLADDEPAPPQDVLAYAAALAGLEPPPLVPLEAAGLSPMALSFYAENKRVRNGRIKEELGVELAFPTYREGLRALRSTSVQAAT